MFPVGNLLMPADSALHVSDYAVTLGGKIMCYAIVALAMDLIWGYTGILSLGHGLFFALGGYAMGMYLMRSIGTEGRLPQRPARLHGVPRLEGVSLVLDATPSTSGTRRCSSCWCPACSRSCSAIFAFRSRIKGVYFSIITQALTYAAMLLFFRNDTGFGGNNGFTDFKRILGYPIAAPSTRIVLFCVTGGDAARRLAARARARRIEARPRAARRSATPRSRVMFSGYNPVHFKLFVWTLSAVMCGIAGALYVPQVGIINPSEMSPANSIEIAIWTAVGGRGTLVGPDLRRRRRQRRARAGSRRRCPSTGCTALGLVFILVTLFLPRGIAGLWDAAADERDRCRLADARRRRRYPLRGRRDGRRR